MTWEPSGDEPWNKHTVMRAIRHILSAQGDTAFIVTRHMQQRLQGRKMSMLDVSNILRGGWLDEARTDWHPKTRSWCYRITTHDMWVEVAFDWPDAIRLVSCGRC
ncbi:MAG: DUF4258 domain-containing protein [Deltaproteobacteria bacterium]|nr:DUF4258 domain-containing protein [Deltaproteobacteria bacterium]